MNTANDLKMAIVVSSPDIYGDVFKVFIELLSKNWPDCKYQIILSNNSLHWEYEKLTVIHNGKNATWNDRVLNALKVVDADYVMIITDDSFISKVVKSQEIEKILLMMKEDSLKYYRLFSSPKVSNIKYNKVDHVHLISKQQPYGRNLMAAIWDKNYYLSKYDEQNLTGWDIESSWLQKTQHATDEYFKDWVSDDRNILNLVHGVYKGKWLPTSIFKLNKLGYKTDTSQRKILPLIYEIVLYSKRIIRNKVSNKNRKNIKNFFGKFGFKSATPY